jgi:hypothetical protein
MAIDGKKLRDSGVYETSAPFPAVLEDLDEIGNMVQAAEAKRLNLKRYGGWSMILGIVSAVAAGFINSNALGFCAFLAFAIGVGLFIYSRTAGRDLHNHHDRYELLRDISKTLQADADPKAKFTVRVALRAAPKLLKDEPFHRKHGKQQFYAEEFLTVSGELLDGTFFEETITAQTRHRTFVNPRGKSKSKTRSRYILAIRFGYPNDIYGDARPAQRALDELIPVPPSAMIKGVGVTGKTIAVKASVMEEKEIPQTSAMVWLGAYRILNLARRAAAKPGP